MKHLTAKKVNGIQHGALAEKIEASSLTEETLQNRKYAFPNASLTGRTFSNWHTYFYIDADHPAIKLGMTFFYLTHINVRFAPRYAMHRFSIKDALLILALGAVPFSSIGAEEGVAKKLSFRSSNPELKITQQRPVPASLGGSDQLASQQSFEALTDQKLTLEGEIRYAKSKLEAARNKQEVNAKAGRPEAADQAAQEIKDWEGRIRNSEAQLAQVEVELQRSNQVVANEAAPDGDGVILPGENVEVFVVEDTSFNGRYQVRRGGYIILPQVGRIYIAGNPVKGAEREVKKALENSQLRKATVMLERVEGVDLESGPVIYLAGEFRSPRPYRIPAATSPSVVSVILSSGGVTDRADLTRVRVMRVAGFKGVVEEVNVQKILDGGGLTSDVRLNDGDVLMIPSTSAVGVYLTGNVRRQGLQQLRRDEKLSAYAAILNAGGFSRFADMKKVYILREMPDGTKAKIPVNVRDIQKGSQADVPLIANDIVVIPEKFFSW